MHKVVDPVLLVLDAHDLAGRRCARARGGGQLEAIRFVFRALRDWNVPSFAMPPSSWIELVLRENASA
jgi:hypothetical protein